MIIRHVLDDHARLTRNVSRDVASEQAGIDVIAGARPVTHEKPQVLAAVEIRDIVGSRRSRKPRRTPMPTAKLV
jgi:hypothetical protein